MIPRFVDILEILVYEIEGGLINTNIDDIYMMLKCNRESIRSYTKGAALDRRIIDFRYIQRSLQTCHLKPRLMIARIW